MSTSKFISSKTLKISVGIRCKTINNKTNKNTSNGGQCESDKIAF